LMPDRGIDFLNALFHGLDFRKLGTPMPFTFLMFVYPLFVFVVRGFGGGGSRLRQQCKSPASSVSAWESPRRWNGWRYTPKGGGPTGHRCRWCRFCRWVWPRSSSGSSFRRSLCGSSSGSWQELVRRRSPMLHIVESRKPLDRVGKDLEDALARHHEGRGLRSGLSGLRNLQSASGEESAGGKPGDLHGPALPDLALRRGRGAQAGDDQTHDAAAIMAEAAR